MKQLRKQERLSEELEEYERGVVSPSKVSDAVIKEICNAEITRAAKLYARDDKDEALAVLEDASEKYGFSLGRLKPIVVNKARNY